MVTFFQNPAITDILCATIDTTTTTTTTTTTIHTTTIIDTFSDIIDTISNDNTISSLDVDVGGVWMGYDDVVDA